MSKVFFTSDLHLGHENCAKWRNMTLTEMHERIIDGWNSKVTKRDVTWIVGDALWSSNAVHVLRSLNGIKHLVMGNHDKLKSVLLEVNRIAASVRYKNKWLLTHIPVHPDSIPRTKIGSWFNLHGHLHGGDKVKYWAHEYQGNWYAIEDLRYMNLNCENWDYKPLAEEELMEILY